MRNPDNTLAIKFPQIAAQWDYDKNIGLTPNDVTPYSKERVWWKCENGHSWQIEVYARANGNGCKYCRNRAVWPGFNDLLSQRPELAKEWDYEANGELTPNNVTYTSNIKIHWICPFGHKWEARIYSRSVKGTGCRVCKRLGTSFAEQAVFYYIRQAFPNAINGYTDKGFELDIFIPSQKIGIEYDGLYSHGVRKKGMRDDKKDGLCAKHGIQLIRIREEGLENTKGAVCIIRENPPSFQGLEKSIKNLFQVLNVQSQIIDIEKDERNIRRQYYEFIKKNSLAERRPDIAAEWNQSNGSLLPTMVTEFAHIRVNWKCPRYNDHIYPAEIYHRTKDNRGCPFCANQKIKPGFNDLATRYEKIALEWSPKNKKKASEVFPNDHKKYLWICPAGHKDYPMSPANKIKGKGCPICSGRIPDEGTNDLLTLFPEIAKEWHPTLNDGKLPNEFKPFSDHEAMWICPAGHPPYPKQIKKRTREHQGCPICGEERRRRKRSKIIRQYDLNGNYIQSFIGASEAAKVTGLKNHTNINTVCKRKQKSAGGFIWRYEDDCSDME